MNDFVLDASVALRWFLDSPVPNYAERVKQSLIRGARALVPALWHLEMSNGLAIAERRAILSSADVNRAIIAIEQLIAQAIDTENSLPGVRQSLGTARAFHLSAYDAVYLDAARQSRLPIATVDEQLRGAAKQAGIELLR